MRWIRRLLSVVSKEEREGIALDLTGSYWEVDGPRTFQDLLIALHGWLPEDAVMYFEDGSPDSEIKEFMTMYSIPEQSHVAMGTIWPRPLVFHVPAKDDSLVELTKIMDHHAEPELAMHFHVYRDEKILLQWYDAFCDQIQLSPSIPQEQVATLAARIGGGFKQIVEPGDAD